MADKKEALVKMDSPIRVMTVQISSTNPAFTVFPTASLHPSSLPLVILAKAEKQKSY